uniref:sigma 54-interacting transcriptional regulator n=1 Tax=Desulfobacula toluolica TaxID=28223 RepID=UPI0022B763EA|nr:sigma 54-interacting transcriptional regulator [Desulfobacula toluolica]
MQIVHSVTVCRWNRPMIGVNCASIPGELYESEFFGHKKGAFTGAISDRAGRFQAADGGTLFLDEVGEIPLTMQGKLLRVLQEGLYERIGEEKTRKVDVRIIAATNRNLEKEVAAGSFRKDLYYRLNVFPIEVVPLRERKKDIPLLARHFLNIVSGKMNLPVPYLTELNIRELMNYDWPGNVRELQNVVERAVITSKSGCILFYLPGNSSKVKHDEGGLRSLREAQESKTVFTEKQINTKIRQNIIFALEQCNGKIYGPNGAASLLGLRPTTLTSRISRFKIKKDELCLDQRVMSQGKKHK